MRKIHSFLLVISIILALYELILMMIYHDISLSKLVFLLAVLLGIYSYCFLKMKPPKLITGIVFIAILSFIIIESQILYYSIDHTNHQQYDTILILGAQVRNGKPSPALQYRIDAAKEYLDKDVVFIASGGQGLNESMSEASCIQKWLDPAKQYSVILEDHSTSTRENLLYSSTYFKGRVAVISNSFHLYRVSLIASKLNLDLDLIPAKNHLITYPHFLIREYFGILQLYLSSLF